MWYVYIYIYIFVLQILQVAAQQPAANLIDSGGNLYSIHTIHMSTNEEKKEKKQTEIERVR